MQTIENDPNFQTCIDFPNNGCSPSTATDAHSSCSLSEFDALTRISKSVSPFFRLDGLDDDPVFDHNKKRRPPLPPAPPARSTRSAAVVKRDLTHASGWRSSSGTAEALARDSSGIFNTEGYLWNCRTPLSSTPSSLAIDIGKPLPQRGVSAIEKKKLSAPRRPRTWQPNCSFATDDIIHIPPELVPEDVDSNNLEAGDSWQIPILSELPPLELPSEKPQAFSTTNIVMWAQDSRVKKPTVSLLKAAIVAFLVAAGIGVGVAGFWIQARVAHNADTLTQIILRSETVLSVLAFWTVALLYIKFLNA